MGNFPSCLASHSIVQALHGQTLGIPGTDITINIFPQEEKGEIPAALCCPERFEPLDLGFLWISALYKILPPVAAVSPLTFSLWSGALSQSPIGSGFLSSATAAETKVQPAPVATTIAALATPLHHHHHQ